MTENPQVRVIYFAGIKAAIEKQLRYLELDLAKAQEELDQAKAELKEIAATNAKAAAQG